MMRKRRFSIVLIAGAAITIGCALAGYWQLAGTITAAVPRPVPGRFDVSLGTGQWEIYQLTGTQTGASVGGVSVNVTHHQAPSLTAAMLTVTAPGGSQLPVQNQSAGTTETLQQGSEIY